MIYMLVINEHCSCVCHCEECVMLPLHDNILYMTHINDLHAVACYIYSKQAFHVYCFFSLSKKYTYCIN